MPSHYNPRIILFSPRCGRRGVQHRYTPYTYTYIYMCVYTYTYTYTPVFYNIGSDVDCSIRDLVPQLVQVPSPPCLPVEASWAPTSQVARYLALARRVAPRDVPRRQHGPAPPLPLSPSPDLLQALVSIETNSTNYFRPSLRSARWLAYGTLRTAFWTPPLCWSRLAETASTRHHTM